MGAPASASASIVAPGEELDVDPPELAVDLVEPGQHSGQIAAPGSGLGLLAERRELHRPESPAVALQRVSRTPGVGRGTGGCGPAQRLELDRRVLEKLVDELGEELRIVAHAFAQLVEHGTVEDAAKFSHVTRRPRA